MSLGEDSPRHSSSSGGLCSNLDAELDNASDASGDSEEVSEGESNSVEESDCGLDLDRVKRQKVELCLGITNPQNSSSQGDSSEILGSLPGKELCGHPGYFRGMCVLCGLPGDDAGSAVALKYIDKNLMIANDEMARIRGKELKDLICKRRKLYLILDLDHTLLNSAWLIDIREEELYFFFERKEELYLNSQRDALPDALKSNLFKLDKMHMMIKLRSFVHTFLEEASSLFEMYIYTMGERPYALEMAKLLDPKYKYFHSRIIAQGDCTQEVSKGSRYCFGARKCSPHP